MAPMALAIRHHCTVHVRYRRYCHCGNGRVTIFFFLKCKNGVCEVFLWCVRVLGVGCGWSAKHTNNMLYHTIIRVIRPPLVN